jgi:hypothetical protein
VLQWAHVRSEISYWRVRAARSWSGDRLRSLLASPRIPIYNEDLNEEHLTFGYSLQDQDLTNLSPTGVGDACRSNDRISSSMKYVSLPALRMGYLLLWVCTGNMKSTQTPRRRIYDNCFFSTVQMLYSACPATITSSTGTLEYGDDH